MAQASRVSPSGVDKAYDDVRSSSQDQDPEAPLETASSHAQEDYDLETVEKVYRKLDMRIIPGRQPVSPITNRSC